MEPQGPFVQTIQSSKAVSYQLSQDGVAFLNVQLPEPVYLPERYAVKIAYVYGASRPVFFFSPLVQAQGFNDERRVLLGSSLQAANVFVPLNISNYIGSSLWLRIVAMDGQPLERLDDLVLALYFVPQSDISCDL